MKRHLVWGILALAIIVAGPNTLGTLGYGTSDAKRPPYVPCTAPLLDAPAHGKQAVDALGPSIAAVAVQNHTTEKKLTRKFKGDDSMWADTCGSLFYVEPQNDPIADPAPVTIPQLTVADPFALHSRAGANRVLYLDFDGQLMSNTAWNASYNGGADWTAAPFDFDGVPGSFSIDEKAIVQSVWQRVSEDFSAFDVDITTQDPGIDAIDRTGSTDQTYGGRVLITNDSVIFNACQCGGLSYVGVFDYSSGHQYYQPSLVFERGLGYSPKNLAEAASHEAGHALGLSHDGTTTSGYYMGQGAWAPIMGVGYYEAITQWSRGDYNGANNTEDDYAVMASHGAPLRGDDAGDTRATARLLPPDLTASGVIEDETDVDWYTFSGSGQTSVSADPVSVSPDLDLSLDLYDSAGNLIMHSDPPSSENSSDVATGLNASVTATLAPDTYYIRLDGVGEGNPLSAGYDDYASVGQYRLRVTTSTTAGQLGVTTTSLPTATYGVSYTALLDASGGTMPYSWSLASGRLPASISLSSTGFLAGVPTDAAGSYPVTLRVTDAMGETTSKSLTLNLVDPPLTVTSTAPLPPAQLTLAYSTQLTATGSRGSYTWSLYSGALPTGLTMTSAGYISGIPTKSATTTFTVKVATATASTTKTLTLAVSSLLKVSTATLADGTVGTAYSASLSGSGGVTPYTWSLDSGSLPAGLNLVGAKITGTPTEMGTSTFTVRIIDAAGRTTTKTLSITVYNLQILTTAAPNATKNTFYSFQFEATGGKGILKWTRSSGTLPTGLTLSTTGLLSGTPSAAGTFTFTLKVIDAANRAKTYTYVVIVS